MDDLLPSYESVIDQNPWLYIAEYLPSEALCSAALVCRKWHAIMTPLLWGKPASHFGVQNDTVYVALTRFKRILPYVRPSVRALTHTLQFPPAHAELYGGPHAEWLRDCLEYLPRLQCLIVNGLPFFDHASLLNLRHISPRSKVVFQNGFSVFSLRLLDASGCTNATSTGLKEALPHFPDLVSLDLSRTLAAKDEAVLDNLKYLRNLRVLNLRGLGLKDSEFAIVAQAVGTRVRSLDLSENHLTDASVRLLLDHCLKESPVEPHRTRGPRPPVEHGKIEGEVDSFEHENLVGHLRKKLTGGFVGSLAIEEARNVGITHLYLSNNSVTVEGISGLLRSQRLQVLDIGVLPTLWENPFPDVTSETNDEVQLPSVSKLTPILSEYASTKLKYLRVNYKLVTDDAPLETLPSPRAELCGDLGHQIPANAQELEAIEPSISELDSTERNIAELPEEANFAVELPGSMPMTGSHDISHQTHQSIPSKQESKDTPAIEVTPEPIVIKRGAANAPEPVFLDSPLSPVSPHLDVHQSPIRPSSPNSLGDHLSPILQSFEGEASSGDPRMSRSRTNSTYYVEDRRARLDLRQSQENRLHPNMLPKVHTLVLTDIPTKTTDVKVVQRLIQYIKDAAEESSIAKQRARHTYVLPPGRSRVTAEKEYVRSVFALQRIVFEMAAPEEVPKKISSSWRAYPTKSSTEDKDSEAFWEAATHDFSFFGDEECGLPTQEPGRTLPLAAMSGLQLAPPQPKPVRRIVAEHEVKLLLDVVSEIAKFRKDRKAAYENLVHLAESEPEVEGYWPGNITVVRKPAASDAGELDCYGNRYEAGWYYR